MQTILIETKIAAPPERYFLLSLSIDLHMESTATTRERAIGGVTHGLIGPGQTVTWQGRHFGLTLAHQSLITKYEPPCHFQDVMLKGMFRTFEHDHYFEQLEEGSTIMRDELRFSAPLGPLGRVLEFFILRDYLTRFLKERNRTIHAVAESSQDTWQRFVK